MIARTIVGAIAVVSLQLGISGCDSEKIAVAKARFASEFHVSDDDGAPLAGVVISTGKTCLGTTGPGGLLRTALSGAEGQLVPVTVACPDGFEGSDKPTPLRLTHTRGIKASSYQPMHVEAICPRNLRDIIVVVRTEAGTGLALQVQGEPAGTTDADGIAQVLVRAERATRSLTVTLDTSAREDLRPKNPTRTYELTGNDTILVFDQTFVATPKPAFRGVTRPKRHIPTRID